MARIESRSDSSDPVVKITKGRLEYVWVNVRAIDNTAGPRDNNIAVLIADTTGGTNYVRYNKISESNGSSTVTHSIETATQYGHKAVINNNTITNYYSRHFPSTDNKFTDGIRTNGKATIKNNVIAESSDVAVVVFGRGDCADGNHTCMWSDGTYKQSVTVKNNTVLQSAISAFGGIGTDTVCCGLLKVDTLYRL